jgi:hypothetical protein
VATKAEGKDVARKKSDKVQISPEDFVRAWQTAESMEAFTEATGIESRAGTSRAVIYRKKGIPLKKFPRGGNTGRPSLDVKALAELAVSLAPKE